MPLVGAISRSFAGFTQWRTLAGTLLTGIYNISCLKKMCHIKVALFLTDGGEAGCKEMKSETHKGLKCVTLICLLCPMLVIIHFRKCHIRKEKKRWQTYQTL